MYKSGMTKTLYQDFKTSYISFNSPNLQMNEAYVYVDSIGIKLLTDVDFESIKRKDVFALSTNEDGFIEALTFSE